MGIQRRIEGHLGLDSPEKLARHIGDPRMLAEELDTFQTLVLEMESQRSELLLKHPDQWVAIGKGGIVAAADTMGDLFNILDEKGIRREDVFHDYMDTNPRTLLL